VQRLPVAEGGSWWGDRWRRIEKSIALLVEDTAKFTAGILALTIGYGLLRALVAIGYPLERVESLEVVHYYALAAVICMFLIDLVLKVAGGLFLEP
jgi:hypothetical protein